MTALLDTGFLLAVIDQADQYHAACTRALLSEASPRLPDVVLPELAYLLLRNLGHQPLATFLHALDRKEIPIEHFRDSDLLRARELLLEYADNKVDFVDCVIVAMAERLGVRRVLTLDRRHFSVFRPRHCNYFEIVPEAC